MNTRSMNDKEYIAYLEELIDERNEQICKLQKDIKVMIKYFVDGQRKLTEAEDEIKGYKRARERNKKSWEKLCNLLHSSKCSRISKETKKEISDLLNQL